MSVTIDCPFMSALLVYSGYWLFQTDEDEQRRTTYHFDMPEWSYAEIRDA
jgi:hypothetical protein